MIPHTRTTRLGIAPVSQCQKKKKSYGDPFLVLSCVVLNSTLQPWRNYENVTVIFWSWKYNIIVVCAWILIFCFEHYIKILTFSCFTVICNFHKHWNQIRYLLIKVNEHEWQRACYEEVFLILIESCWRGPGWGGSMLLILERTTQQAWRGQVYLARGWLGVAGRGGKAQPLSTWGFYPFFSIICSASKRINTRAMPSLAPCVLSSMIKRYSLLFYFLWTKHMQSTEFFQFTHKWPDFEMWYSIIVTGIITQTWSGNLFLYIFIMYGSVVFTQTDSIITAP